MVGSMPAGFLKRCGHRIKRWHLPASKRRVSPGTELAAINRPPDQAPAATVVWLEQVGSGWGGSVQVSG